MKTDFSFAGGGRALFLDAIPSRTLVVGHRASMVTQDGPTNANVPLPTPSLSPTIVVDEKPPRQFFGPLHQKPGAKPSIHLKK